MTMTPDEIKEWLGDPVPVHFHVGNPEPHLTPLAYRTLEELFADALAYIQQLEAERDAAVKDIELFPDCSTCKYDPRKKGYIPNDCDDCVEHCNYKWRGVQKEE